MTRTVATKTQIPSIQARNRILPARNVDSDSLFLAIFRVILSPTVVTNYDPLGKLSQPVFAVFVRGLAQHGRADPLVQRMINRACFRVVKIPAES